MCGLYLWIVCVRVFCGCMFVRCGVCDCVYGVVRCVSGVYVVFVCFVFCVCGVCFDMVCM